MSSYEISFTHTIFEKSRNSFKVFRTSLPFSLLCMCIIYKTTAQHIIRTVLFDCHRTCTAVIWFYTFLFGKSPLITRCVCLWLLAVFLTSSFRSEFREYNWAAIKYRIRSCEFVSSLVLRHRSYFLVFLPHHSNMHKFLQKFITF